METYAQVLSYAIPGFVVLIIIEYIASLLMGQNVGNTMDTISSLSSGMTNTLKEILGLAVVIVSYGWMVDHFALLSIQSETWLYLLCFVLVDFASYWSHRFNHEINVMWNRHIIHHSSEEFNLSCALRQSISGIIGVYFFLYIPLALIGIPGNIIAVVAPLHLFAQFWYHTRLINRMGPLEHIIVTPSHHRVHHAINPEYIDKNYAAIFIIWDKMFGTFQEESADIPPVYGVKKPVLTWNPFLINFQHVTSLAKDAWRTKRWSDKFKLWFMPTGWRPEDVAEAYPIEVIEDVYAYAKYKPDVPNSLKIWSGIQLVVINALMYFMLVQIADIDAAGILLYAAFLGSSIFAYTSLMDVDRIAIPAEIVKLVFAYLIFQEYNNWFELSDILPFSQYIIVGYLIVSLCMTLYFTIKIVATQNKKTVKRLSPTSQLVK